MALQSGYHVLEEGNEMAILATPIRTYVTDAQSVTCVCYSDQSKVFLFEVLDYWRSTADIPTIATDISNRLLRAWFIGRPIVKPEVAVILTLKRPVKTLQQQINCPSSLLRYSSSHWSSSVLGYAGAGYRVTDLQESNTLSSYHGLKTTLVGTAQQQSRTSTLLRSSPAEQGAMRVANGGWLPTSASSHQFPQAMFLTAQACGSRMSPIGWRRVADDACLQEVDRRHLVVAHGEPFRGLLALLCDFAALAQTVPPTLPGATQEVIAQLLHP